MSRRSLTVFGGLVLVMTFVSAAARTQTELSFQAPFEFRAWKTVLPAGRYDIRISGPDQGEVTLTSEATGKTIVVPYVTRLARRDSNEGEVVFDTAENVSYLAEIHFPGLDGFAFAGAQGKHTHTKVRLQGKK
jgi:hypothetical protein